MALEDIKDMDDFNVSLPQGFILDDRYEIIEVIGRGGFGITYKALNKLTGHTVAIKMLHDTNREKFMKEARVLRDFSDEKSVVTVLDYFEVQSDACIVMEYLDGVTLREHISKEGPWEVETAVRRFTPIMEALERIHASGIIHRDISPDNLMILEDGSLKLLDFGAAKNYVNVTVTKMGVYKSSYSPPEQMEGNGMPGTFTDVYSLCATFCYCITGKDPEDVLSRLLFDELKKPSEIGAAIEPQAEKLLLKGLKLDSSERLQTVTELREGLNAIYPDLTEEERKAAETRKRKKRTIIAAGIVTSVLLAGIICYLNRIPLLFHFIETEKACLDGSDMSEEEFRHSADIVKARVNAFTNGTYLWQENGRTIYIEVPYDLFGNHDPQQVIRMALTRPMQMYISGKDSDGLEKDYGLFSQLTDVESMERTERGLTLTFSEEARERFDEILWTPNQVLSLVLDREGQYLIYGSIMLITTGDGKSVVLDDGSIILPDALRIRLLTTETSDAPFSVEGEWKVNWEDPEKTMFVGKNQVSASSLRGETICLCYKSSGGSNTGDMNGYDVSGLSMEAIIKNRLDSIGIPYAIGQRRWDPGQIIVKCPTDDVWQEELISLGETLRLYLGSRTARLLNYGINSLEVSENTDGTECLTAIISKYNVSDVETALKTLLSQGCEKVYLYRDYEPIASGDADIALQMLRESSQIQFDQWCFDPAEKFSSETMHFARFLMTAYQQRPQSDFDCDASQQLISSDGSVSFYSETETSSLSDWHFPTFPRDVLNEWNQDPSVEYRYFDDLRELSIHYYKSDIDKPSEKLQLFEKFYRDNKELLESSLVATVYIRIMEAPDNIAAEPYISIMLSNDFNKGSYLVESGYINAVDKTSKRYQDLVDTYNQYLDNNPLFKELCEGRDVEERVFHN